MRLRAPSLEDAPAVHALIVARDTLDYGVAEDSLEDLLDSWRQSDLDLDLDVRVAEADGGAIIGYAIVMAPGTLAMVAPDREGEGLGSRLREWAEQRDQARGRRRHTQWVSPSNERARSLLQAAGYSHVRSYRRLARALDGVEAAPAPAGVHVRPLELDRDAVAVHALNEASFSGNADYRPESLEQFTGHHLRGHSLDAGLSCVAEDDGQAVGFLLARRLKDEGVGFVDLLGVHPDHRRRGLAMHLLTRAFVQFAAAGFREAQLGVASDNARAARLYERCGMDTRYQADTYERDAMG